MRKTTFRAKRTDEHPVYWAYGYFVKTPITAEFNADTPADNYFDTGKGRYCIVTEHGVAHEIDPETLCESTSLKDKNGKEIYEGDVVELRYKDGSGESTYEIVWGTYGYDRTTGFHPVRDGETLNHFYGGWDGENLTVVGNIYQNPELLK